MQDAAGKTDRLEKILEKTLLDHPHSRDVIDAFRPVIMGKSVLMDTLTLEDCTAPSFDEPLFGKGIPLLQQDDFSPAVDVCDRIALTMLTALKEGFPSLCADLEKIASAVRAGRIRISDCFARESDGYGTLIDTWARDEGVSGQTLGLAVSVTGRTVLEKTARAWAGLIRDLSWDRGCCPICGSPPMISRIQEGKGTRLLHCSLCGHEWAFSRVVCPSCGNSDQKAMTYFFIEDRKAETAFVCEACGQYLITVDKVSDLADFDADIAALSLVHLDIILQKKGYRPMAQCAWNTY